MKTLRLSAIAIAFVGVTGVTMYMTSADASTWRQTTTAVEQHSMDGGTMRDGSMRTPSTLTAISP